MGAPVFEAVQSANVTPDKVPEVIARTIVNLPPEQVVDLMKQMQVIIKEYPTEARTILIQNPQLTYAMLQSLVIIGLIPPSEATSFLHQRPDLPSLNLIGNPPPPSVVPTPTNLVNNLRPTLPVPNPSFPVTSSLIPQPPLPIVPIPPFHPHHMAPMNYSMAGAPVQQPQSNSTVAGGSPLSRTDQEKAQLLMQVLQLNKLKLLNYRLIKERVFYS